MASLSMTYFSDVLCIWAYVAQMRIDRLKSEFGERVSFENRFCSVFGDAHGKVRKNWNGDYAAFNRHLRDVAAAHPDLHLHPDVWLAAQPASSTSVHLTLKAVGLVEEAGTYSPGTTDQICWAFRCAFFRDAKDIADWSVQEHVIHAAGLDPHEAYARIRDGSAFAALAADYAEAEARRVQGSPSFVLNQGRQMLYGNVGYRVIKANLEELLREPLSGEASWC